MAYLFHLSPVIIIFIHVISAVLWIGGMVALRFALHPHLTLIDDPRQRLELGLLVMQRFFNLMRIFIVLVFVSALILVLAIDFHTANLGLVVYLKEFIWSVMTINFGVMYYLRTKAHKAFFNQEYFQTKDTLHFIASRLIPTNIFLGVVAVLFGVILRGY